MNRLVVGPGIDVEQKLEPVGALGRAPRPTAQGLEPIAKHRAGMVETKERVKASAFELSLADDTAAAAQMRLVENTRQ